MSWRLFFQIVLLMIIGMVLTIGIKFGVLRFGACGKKSYKHHKMMKYMSSPSGQEAPVGSTQN